MCTSSCMITSVRKEFRKIFILAFEANSSRLPKIATLSGFRAHYDPVSCSLPVFLDDCLSPIIFHVHTAQNGINDFTLYTSIACWNELDATFKGVLLEGEAGSKRDTDALCPYTLSVLNSCKS